MAQTKTVEVSSEGRGPRLAIRDEEFGPKIRSVRVLMPKEVRALDVVKKIQRGLEEIDAYDDEMKSRLEAALDSPEDLRALTGKYLDEAARMRLGVWGEEGADYRELEEADLILAFLIREYRPDLKGFRIATVFTESIAPVNRRGRLGTAFRMPGKMKHLSGVDAVVTLGFDHWRFLSDRDRQRLIHHEIEHFDTDDGKVVLVGHDFEEFVSIAVEYGLRSESGRFNTDGETADALFEVAGQLELLNPTLPDPSIGPA